MKDSTCPSSTSALNISNQAYRTASTKELYSSALRNPMRFEFIKPRNVKLGASKLIVGDIEIFSTNSDFTRGHTAFVILQKDKQTTINIEGNTVNTNTLEEQREQTSKSRNKGGVYSGKIRVISDNPKFKTVGFIRIRGK